MKRAIAVAVVGGGVLIASVYTITWRNSPEVPRPLSSPNAGPIRVALGERSAARRDIEDMPQGGRVEIPFVVFNSGSAAVTVGPIGTSCDCFRVELDATCVEAGTEVGGRAVIDLAGEPKFAGGLMLNADAVAAEDGRPVFALKLSVRVK